MFNTLTDVTGIKVGHYTVIGSEAAEVVADSILRAIGPAETLAGIPAAKEVI